MDGKDGTINDTTGESSAPVPQESSDGLVSTVEFFPIPEKGEGADTDPDGANNTDGADKDQTAAGTQAGEKADGKEAGSNADDMTRFDQHPRFVELNTRMKAAEESNRQLMAQIAQLSQTKQTGQEQESSELPYKDISKMSDDEILDWQSEDPKGYIDNINKMIGHQVQEGIKTALASNKEEMQMSQYETQVEQTYRSYAEANPDFDDLWDSGKIKQYMDDHPGHNAISAHMAITAEGKQKELVDKAVKDALTKAETDRRTVRKAGAILPSGPNTAPMAPSNSDAELQNPKQFGGDTSVLAARLERRRAMGP